MMDIDKPMRKNFTVYMEKDEVVLLDKVLVKMKAKLQVPVSISRVMRLALKKYAKEWGVE